MTATQAAIADRATIMRWVFAFFSLAASALAGPNLDILVNAAASFSITISQQLRMLHSNPSVAAFAEKTIDYAEAKRAYFEALRAVLPALRNVATGEDERSPEIDKFAAALAVAGEEQVKAADEGTLTLFVRFSHDPRIEKAKSEFERAQKAEQNFHKDFDGLSDQ